ncbi:LssY C-terminal domain-containing protein [Occallatibacter riparius]|uniref:LssY C-terminal domain-containing protein n=1 Tax=Occallatibacter riparius TaxID=1002689 RepID=A0A9J7BTC1_9BACT|nr:LssY C-terminal domain-containing protein [Occallatibacter riparius]UWZ85896.1 LssY C-terminal domain-containing protein [Occallatibacter riparius]
MRTISTILVMITMALLTLLIGAQTHELDLKPADGWVDTKIDLVAGDSLHITASGHLQYSTAKQPNGPEGLPRGYWDLIRLMPFNDGGRGALIGRIGDSDAARPFLIGPELTMRSPVAGRLFVGINQPANDSVTGSYGLKISCTAAAKAEARAEVTVAAFTQELIDSIPRRVSDASGNLGDRVNFVLIGSSEQVKAALKAAGWVVVDRTRNDAVLSAIVASVSKQGYVTLPMSELLLFDRVQDYGYAQADPFQVVASRHHFRIWKAPFQLSGQEVWAGAGMHDVGFDRDQRTNGVTHKIDPDSDKERDYIRDSLLQSGMVIKTDYITPTDPVLNATTATGSAYTSDGRTLLVYLGEAQQ